MNEKHTPGEWLRDGTTVYALNEQGTNRLVISVQGGFVYQPHDRAATADKYERTPDAEIEASARLVAAAPDLLAALKRLERTVRILPSDMDEPDSPLAQARTALAKAVSP